MLSKNTLTLQKKFYIFFGLFSLLKIIEFIWLWNMLECYHGTVSWLASKTGDTFSYLESMENLLTADSYHFNNGKDNVYAGRMPNYGILYYILRHFFSVSTCYTIQTCFQLLIELFTVYLLCNTIKSITKVAFIEYFLLLFLGLSVHWTNFSIILSPESLSISFLLITICTYYQYKANPSNLKLLLTGLSLAFLVGLKPYLGILAPLLGVDFLLMQWKTKQPLKKVIYRSLFYGMPLVLMLACWSYRNYQVIGKPYLFTEPSSGYLTYSNPIYQSYRQLVVTWGESDEYWNPSAIGSFFYEKYPTNYTIDQIPTTSYFTKDSIVMLKTYLKNMHNYSPKETKAIASQLDKYTASFTAEDSFLGITSRLSLLSKFLFHSGSYYLPVSRNHDCFNWLQFLFKIMQSLLYYFFLCSGSIGLVLIYKETKEYLFLFIPIFLLILFCFIVRVIEWRYFAPGVVCLSIGSAYCMSILYRNIIDYIKGAKKTS